MVNFRLTFPNGRGFGILWFHSLPDVVCQGSRFVDSNRPYGCGRGLLSRLLLRVWNPSGRTFPNAGEKSGDGFLLLRGWNWHGPGTCRRGISIIPFWYRKSLYDRFDHFPDRLDPYPAIPGDDGKEALGVCRTCRKILVLN